MLNTLPARNLGFQRQQQRNGYRSDCGIRFCRFLILVFCLFSAQAQARSALELEPRSILQLASSGAIELSLGLIDKNQPSWQKHPGYWLKWERLRYRLLQENHAWELLLQRTGQMPSNVPESFVVRATELRVVALMQTGAYRQARTELQKLLWQTEASQSVKLHSRWRVQVLQSYLAEGLYDDAYVAMLRYQQEFDVRALDIYLRYAILVKNALYKDARRLLQSLPEQEERVALNTLVDLHQGRDAVPLIHGLRAALSRSKDKPQARWLLWAVMARATEAGDDPASRVMALEYLLGRPEQPEAFVDLGVLFDFNADELWQAYYEYGLMIGNREQLLVGEDEAWFAFADTLSLNMPVTYRSMMALVAAKGGHRSGRALAHKKLFDSVVQMPQSAVLLETLYIQAREFARIKRVPAVVRYHLADAALRAGELEEASNLLQGLEKAPQGAEALGWQMRRAKVFLLAGDYPQAGKLIHEMFDMLAYATDYERDRYLQLLFDLQSVGRNKDAYTLLEKLYLRVDDPQLQRELLYWMADSKSALEEYAEAAYLYIRSANALEDGAMDPWAQTARYQAARSLISGHMYKDGEQVYRQLLAVTEEQARRAVILRDLEQIQLLKKMESDH